jgi:hypothetical protein
MLQSNQQQQGFISIPSSCLEAGDKIFISIEGKDPPNFSSNNAYENWGYLYKLDYNSSFTINQNPQNIPGINIVGNGVPPNQLWGYPDPINYPNVITSSNQGLITAYGINEIRMKNRLGSGFNPIQLPFLINVADQFRFEGREMYKYVVKKVFTPAESGSGRVSASGSIEVHFTENLPVSSNPDYFNLDHFLIRRFVNDAASNIMEGFKPFNQFGPYLVKPEFVVPELDKSIDQIVLDLTEKGFIFPP